MERHSLRTGQRKQSENIEVPILDSKNRNQDNDAWFTCGLGSLKFRRECLALWITNILDRKEIEVHDVEPTP